MGLETAHMNYRTCPHNPCYSLWLRSPAPFPKPLLMDLLVCMVWPGIQTYLYLILAHLFFPESKVHWQLVSLDQPSHDDTVAWWSWSVWTILSISDRPVGYLLETVSTQWMCGGVWKTWKLLFLVSLNAKVKLKDFLWLNCLILLTLQGVCKPPPNALNIIKSTLTRVCVISIVVV